MIVKRGLTAGPLPYPPHPAFSLPFPGDRHYNSLLWVGFLEGGDQMPYLHNKSVLNYFQAGARSKIQSKKNNRKCHVFSTKQLLAMTYYSTWWLALKGSFTSLLSKTSTANTTRKQGDANNWQSGRKRNNTHDTNIQWIKQGQKHEVRVSATSTKGSPLTARITRLGLRNISCHLHFPRCVRCCRFSSPPRL